MQQATLIRLAAGLGGLSVALGAFGAHGLEQLVAPERVANFVTGVRYQFYHALAIGLAAALYGRDATDRRWLTRAVYAWLAGTLLFSGSLYALSLREVIAVPTAVLGPITPVGGLLLIGGWACCYAAARSTAA